MDKKARTLPPRRRWFQFGLRTLLVLIALLSLPLAWFGWQVTIVRKRQAILADVKTRGGVCIEEFIWDAFGPAAAPEPKTIAEWVRRRLGDEPISDIRLSTGYTAAEVSEIEATFPEAEVRHWTLKP